MALFSRTNLHVFWAVFLGTVFLAGWLVFRGVLLIVGQAVLGQQAVAADRPKTGSG